jgi:Mlc titration factor MtfA (ptsG expression regulator)
MAPGMIPDPLADPFFWLVVVLLVGVAIIALAVLAGRSRRFRALLDWAGGRSLRARLRARRRRRLLRKPFPPAWEEIVRRNLGLYSLLTPAEQGRLRAIVRVLVAEKRWVGCAGLRVTNEMRVTIAAAAAVLILARPNDWYEPVGSILVYPTLFEVPDQDEHEDEDDTGVVKGQPSFLGQAWYRGPIILAWDEVLHDCRQPFGEQNLVYHEFAHALDFEGAPLGATGDDAHRRFTAVLEEEYQALVRDVNQGRPTLLDDYGASNPAEFFAVATECFFGQPVELLEQQPRLYEVLRDFYNQDPVRRASGPPLPAGERG